MNKIIPFTIAFMFIIFISGCATQIANEDIAKEILEASNNIKSYKFDMTNKVDMDISIFGKQQSASMLLAIKSDVDKENKNIFMDMGVTAQGQSGKQLAYVLKDTMYVKSPQGSWIKQRFSEEMWQTQSQYDFALELLNDSKVELLEEETIEGKQNYVIKITPNLNKLLKKSFSTLSSSGTQAQSPEGINSSKIIKDFFIKIWVQKDTFYISKFNYVISLDSSNEKGEGFKINMNIESRMYDYNKPIKIELPEEAKNARDMDQGIGMAKQQSLPKKESAKTSVQVQTGPVKCDGKTYSIAVKPNHAIMDIQLTEDGLQRIAELKSEGLIEDFFEVVRNKGTAYSKLSFSSGGGSGTMSFPPGWIILMADVKKENSETVWNRLKEDRGSHGLGYNIRNFEDKETTFEYSCKVIELKNSGRITLYSNIPEANFTVTGPASYSGSGICWTKFDAPAGEYKIIWNDVAGYTAPGRFTGYTPPPGTPPLSLPMTLVGEGHSQLGGTYKTEAPATTGTLVVITNLQEATFTITGPETYSGSGVCWSQTNAPFGQYDINFNDVPGYELPWTFDKRKIILLSEGFVLGGAATEYKKIGEGN